MSQRPRRARTIPPLAMPPFPRPVSTWVGRDADLERALMLLESETLHLVYGVGGVGKSELVFRLFGLARERPAWATAPAVLVGVRPGMAPEHVIAALRAGLGPRRARIVIAGAGAANLDDDLADAARMLDAVPGLVFLDDIHHLDPDVAARMLGFLSRHVRESRIVAASRVEIPLPAGTPPPAIHRLGPLDLGATRDLVQRLAERMGVAPPDAATVFRRSGGSPFYVLRDVAGDASGPGDGGLDTTLRELRDDARALVGALACARAPLAPDDAIGLAGEPALRELGRRFLVDGLRDQVLVHDLVRDAWQRIATRRERATAHRRMGDLYRDRAVKDGKVAPADAGDVVLAVHHLVAAGDADDAWELIEPSYRAVAAAGIDHLLLDDLRTLAGLVSAAREPIALMTARILVRRSLIAEASDVLAALGDRGDAASLRWLILSGEVAQRRGRLGESEALFRRARAAATAPAEHLQAALELADVASLRGQNREARTVLAAAARDHAPLAPRDRGRWGWSETLSYIIEERFAEAAAAARAAAQAVAGGGHEDLEVLLALLEVLARAELDDIVGATALLDRLVVRATATGALRDHVQSLYRGVLAYFAGDLAVAESALDRAFAYLSEHADYVMASIGGYYRVRTHLARGDTAAALDLSARMTRLATAAELETLAPHGRAAHAEALFASGKVDQARATAEAALAAPRVCAQARLVALSVLARAAAHDGDLVSARAHLAVAERDPPQIDEDPDLPAAAERTSAARARRAALDLERASIELCGGDPRVALEAADRARRHFAAVGRRGQEARATIAVAAARIMHSSPDSVERATTEVSFAEVLATATGHRRVLARCALVRAAIARRRGDSVAPFEELADASFPEGRALAMVLGAPDVAPGVRATLAALGLVPGPRLRVISRAGARVIGDTEVDSLRAAHAIVIEPARALIAIGGKTDRGRALLCELLATLVEAGGAVVSPEALFLAVWGGVEYHPLRHRNTLYVALKRLRAALRELRDDDAEIVETAAGGWRLADRVDAIVIRPVETD